MRSGDEHLPSRPARTSASPHPLDPTAAAQAIADRLLELLCVLDAVVYRFEPGSGELEVVAFSGDLGASWPPGLRLARGTGTSGLAVELRAPVISDDVLADPRIALTASTRGQIERGPFRPALSLPLIEGGELVGALSVGGQPGRRFSLEEVRLAEAFAGQAAAVLRNARLYEEALRRGREAVIVAEAARALNATLDLPTVLELVLQGARELCRSDMASIALLDATGEMSHRYVSGSLGGLTSFRIEPGRGAGGLVLQTGRPFRTDDYATDARITKDFVSYAASEGIIASLVVPIQVGQRIEGLLYTQNREPRPFTDDDEAVLVRLAGHASTAIANARLYGEAQARLGQTETLLAVSRSLAAAHDLTETMRLVSRELGRALGASMVVALVPDVEGIALRPVAGYRVPMRLREPSGDLSFRLDDHPVLLAARHEHRAIFESQGRHAFSLPPEVDARLPDGSAMFVPMLLKEEMVGGLFAMWWPPRERPSADELGLAEAIASQAALFAATARSYEELDARRRSAERLAEVGQLVSQSLDPAVVQHRIAESICALLGAAVAHVFRLDVPSGDLLAEATAGPGIHDVTPWSRRYRAGHGAAGLATASRRVVTTANVLTDPRISIEPERRAWIELRPYRSVLAVPLLVQGEVIGALSIVDREGRRYTPDQIHLAETFASHAAVAFHNARLHAEATRRRHGAEQLAEASRLMANALHPLGVARAAVDHLRAIVGGQSVFLCRLEPTSRQLVPLALAGDAGSAMDAIRVSRTEASIGALAVARRETLATADVLEDPRFQLPPRLRTAIEGASSRALLIAPLILRTRVIGALGVARPAGHHFAPEEVEIVETFAAKAATALDRTRLVADLRRALRSITALSRRLLTVQEDERGRLARELHDEIGQHLTGLKLTLDATALGAATGAGQRAILADARATAGELIDRVREIATELRPPVLDDLGLLDALTGHCARFTRQTGITVRFDAAGLDGRRFPPSVEVAAYRIIQEALTNVARHARVDHARVWLGVHGTTLEGGVEDTGAGCDPVRLDSERSVGVAGMRERAQILGGRLTVVSVEGQGTRVTFELPLSHRADGRGRGP